MRMKFLFMLNDEWNISPAIAINYGIRVPYYSSKDTAYTLLEPRATLKVSLNRTTSIKASYTKMNQFVHAVPYSSASLPTDIWIASNALVKPQNSTQYSIGIFKNFEDNLYEASLEVYHKDMKNQVLFKQGTQLNIQSEIEEELAFGKGASNGIELFLKKIREG